MLRTLDPAAGINHFDVQRFLFGDLASFPIDAREARRAVQRERVLGAERASTGSERCREQLLSLPVFTFIRIQTRQASACIDRSTMVFAERAPRAIKCFHVQGLR